jgi:acetyl-CoA acetyltransferase
MNIREKYAVVGVGYTPQGAISGRTALSYYLEAGASAIADAGLKREDIDGLICYRHFSPRPGEAEITPYLVAQHLGLAPHYLSMEANCGRTHLAAALGAMEIGLCRHVLVIYADNAMLTGITCEEMTGDGAVFGHYGVTAGYAMAARRAMHEFHTGPETWKEIAVATRRWANLNPRAVMHDRPLTCADYYQSRWVTEPFRLCDCCLMSNGGRAYVVTSRERARQLRQPPVLVMGIGQHNPSTGIFQSTTMAGPTGAKLAGEQALRTAGISIREVDAGEIYDCFTYTVEITLQDYGFFAPGEGASWFKDGATGPGGRFPVNTSGGLLSEVYMMGLTPFTEAVMQLMGRCGEHQLGPRTGTRSPEIIIVSDNGAVLQTHACAILRRG